jgi:hypothetical protein
LRWSDDEAKPGKRPWKSYIPYDLIGTLGRFKTTSVLAPLLVVEIIVGVFALGLTALIGPDHTLTWVLWSAFLAILALIGLAYFIWSLVNPNRLQTEDYQIQQQVIKVLTDERHPGKTIEHEPLTSNTAAIGVGK